MSGAGDGKPVVTPGTGTATVKRSPWSPTPSYTNPELVGVLQDVSEGRVTLTPTQAALLAVRMRELGTARELLAFVALNFAENPGFLAKITDFLMGSEPVGGAR